MPKKKSGRIHLLDELRGLSIILMVFFHAFYLLGYEFKVEWCRDWFHFFEPLQPVFAGLFIFLCGISCNLSRNNLKRGLLLALVAVLLSAVMWCAVYWRMVASGSYVWFGILQLLSVSILLYALLHKALNVIPPLVGILIMAVLFVLCYHIPVDKGHFIGFPGWIELSLPTFAYDHPLYYVLGLCPISECADYFPLLPWVFCFFAGCYGGVYAKRGKFPSFTYREYVPFFGTIGKQSLWIYLLHQPVLWGLCHGVDWLYTRVL